MNRDELLQWLADFLHEQARPGCEELEIEEILTREGRSVRN